MSLTAPPEELARRAAEEDLAYAQVGQAHGLLVKSAGGATPVAAPVLQGRLVISKSGWALLTVPNALVRGLFDAMHEPGIELPPSGPNAHLNAHISVMDKGEVEKIGPDNISERGHSFSYQLGPIQSVEPAGWSEMSRVWFVKVTSPELKKLRISYGLTPLPKGDHEFHATIAVRRKKVLHDSGVAKAAAVRGLTRTLSPTHRKAERLVREVVDSITPADLYGAWYNPDEGKVRVSLGDWADGDYRELESELTDLVGEDNVEVDYEIGPPREPGWEKLGISEHIAADLEAMALGRRKQAEVAWRPALLGAGLGAAGGLGLDWIRGRKHPWRSALQGAGLGGLGGLALGELANRFAPVTTSSGTSDPAKGEEEPPSPPPPPPPDAPMVPERAYAGPTQTGVSMDNLPRHIGHYYEKTPGGLRAAISRALMARKPIPGVGQLGWSMADLNTPIAVERSPGETTLVSPGAAGASFVRPGQAGVMGFGATDPSVRVQVATGNPAVDVQRTLEHEMSHAAFDHRPSLRGAAQGLAGGASPRGGSIGEFDRYYGSPAELVPRIAEIKRRFVEAHPGRDVTTPAEANEAMQWWDRVLMQRAAAHPGQEVPREHESWFIWKDQHPPDDSFWERIRRLMPQLVRRESPAGEKIAAAHPVLGRLRAAKRESDRGNYAAKRQILNKLLAARPDEFVQDSTLNRFAGLTHKPTGFRIHHPLADLPSGIRKAAASMPARLPTVKTADATDASNVAAQIALLGGIAAAVGANNWQHRGLNKAIEPLVKVRNEREARPILAAGGLPADLPVLALRGYGNAAYHDPGNPSAALRRVLSADEIKGWRHNGAIVFDPAVSTIGTLAHEAGHARLRLSRPWYSPSRINQSFLRPTGDFLNHAVPMLASLGGAATGSPLVGTGLGLVGGVATSLPTLINEHQATAHARRYLASLPPAERRQNSDALRKAFRTYSMAGILPGVVAGGLGGALGAMTMEKASADLPEWLRKAAARKHDPAYEAETLKIRENARKPENRRPHKFSPAKWTHPNGHPRCIRCGGEQPTGDMCEGSEDHLRAREAMTARARATRAHRVARVVNGLARRHNPKIRAFGREHKLDVSDILVPIEKASADYAPGLPAKSDLGNLSKLRTGQLLDWIVQQHDANRAGRHFDVRFGNQDTGLYSWAARKGLPGPGQKHLAVQQPVHRHGYKDFEGTIEHGYGAGTVKKHAEGQVLLTKVTPDSVHFTTAHQRHPERFVLTRPKGWGNKDWLLLNVTPTDRVPYEKLRYRKIPAEQVEPALRKMQVGDTAEAKVDGASQLIRLAGGHAEMLSFRTSKETGRPIFHTERFFGGRPEVKVPRHLEGSVLKGEMYAARSDGISDADTGTTHREAEPQVDQGGGQPAAGGGLAVRAGGDVEDDRGQHSLGPQDVGTLLNSSIARSLQLQRERGLTPKVMAYDVQQYGRKPVDPTQVPRDERRRMIDEILGHLPSNKFHGPEVAETPEAALAMWDKIRSGRHGLTREGVVIHPHKGVPIKGKLTDEHDVYLTGTFPGTGKRQATFGGFTYGHEKDKTVGRVGSGFTDAFLAEAARNPTPYIGRVARVRAQEKLPSGALRAPVFLGLHEDTNKVAHARDHRDRGAAPAAGGDLRGGPPLQVVAGAAGHNRAAESGQPGSPHPGREPVKEAGDSGSMSAARKMPDTYGPDHKPSWTKQVMTRYDSTKPPKGIFSRPAAEIVVAGKDPHVAPGGLASWQRMVVFHRNRGGARLGEERRAALQEAIEELSKLIREEKKGHVGTDDPSGLGRGREGGPPDDGRNDRGRPRTVDQERLLRPGPAGSYAHDLRGRAAGPGTVGWVGSRPTTGSNDASRHGAVAPAGVRTSADWSALSGANAGAGLPPIVHEGGKVAHVARQAQVAEHSGVDARDARCGGVHGPHGIPGNAGGVQGGLRPLRAGAGRSKAASLLPWVSLQPPQRRVAKKKAIEELSKLIREEKDKEKSAAVEYTEWVDNEDPKQVLNRIDAHAGGRNVGYLTAHPSTEGDGMWLKGLKVAPRFRQHGIGAELMRRALDQYGDRTIRLRPRPYAGSPLDEDQLAAWYGRFGFTPYDSDGRMVRYPEKSASLLPWVSLQPPQRRVAKKVREGNNLLVYHGLGSGKSLASLAAAESVGGPYAAIVPASLRSNYKKEQEKFTDMRTPSDVLSYTGVGMGKQPRVNPQTIIMDEVQRLRNPASAGSRAAMELAMRVPHRVLLSGTPIVNDPHDLAVPISILTGQEMTPREFDRRFVGEKTVHPGLGGWLRGVQPTTVPSIKNEEDLERLLEGHVDYQPSKSPQGVTTNDERVEVDLSPEQQKFYKLMWGKLPWLMRWKLSHDYPLSRDELTHLSSFMTGPRQAALSLYPFHSSRDPLFAYRTSAKLQAAMSSLKETLAKDPRAKAIVYSNFIDAGLTPYAAALAAAKIPYGQFHGTMDEAARKQALDDYNAGRSRVLLLGPAAAEGISAKGTQLIQLLDPHWNEARLGQARGRGLRFDSHEGLPPELRNVRIQRFIARMPQPGLFGRLIGASHRPSADEVLEQQAHRKEELIEPFRDVLRRVGTEPERRPWFGLFG